MTHTESSSIERAVEEIEKFHADLLEKQQPLGKDFEKVLFDNLLDLYVRDDDIPPYVRLKRGWCAKFRRPCYSAECHTVCKLAP